MTQATAVHLLPTQASNRQVPKAHRPGRQAEARDILAALIASKKDGDKVERLCIEAYRLADLMHELGELSDAELSDRRSKVGFR